MLTILLDAQSGYEQRVKQAKLDAERLIPVGGSRVLMEINTKSAANKFRNRKLAFLFFG